MATTKGQKEQKVHFRGSAPHRKIICMERKEQSLQQVLKSFLIQRPFPIFPLQLESNAFYLYLVKQKNELDALCFGFLKMSDPRRVYLQYMYHGLWFRIYFWVTWGSFEPFEAAVL